MSDRIEMALEACHDAAFGVVAWPVALQGLSEALGAVSGALRTRSRPNPFSRRHDDFCGTDSTEHVGFSELWLEKVPGIGDPRFHAVEPSAGACDVIFEDQVVSSEVRARHPFYTQVAGPGGRDWWASVRFEVDGNRWCLPLFRDARRGRFEQAEEEVLRSVAPGLARAIRVAGWVLDLAAGSTLDAFDRTGGAALVLDGDGAVLAMNASAAALMGDALRVRSRRLCAADRSDGDALRALVARAAMGVAEVTPTVLLTLKGRPWLKVDAMPFTGPSHDLFGAGRVLLRLSELVPSTPGEPEQLRRLFGLTVAEARLAVPLARGEGLVAAAERLGIGRETARTQLRAILAKTGTSRQAELAALLACLPRAGPALTRSEDDRPAH